MRPADASTASSTSSVPAPSWPRHLARLVRPALRLGSSRFAREYGGDVVESLAALLVIERRRAGRLAAGVLWMRAMGDGWRAARRARRLDAAGAAGAAGGAPLRPLRDLGGDVRGAARAIARTPVFSLTVILTLASGIGLAAAIFAFADGYLFRPLPFEDAHELYLVRAPDQRREFLRASEAEALRASAVGHYGFVDGMRSSPVSFAMLDLGDRQLRLSIDGVGEGFGAITRVHLALGRYFVDEDHRAGEAVPIWLTHRTFTREFAADPGIIGRRFISAAGPRAVTVEVVGVTGPSVTTFETSFGANNRVPDGFAPARPRQPDSGRVVTLATPIVRLPADVPRERAEAEIAAALQAIAPGRDGSSRRIRLDSWQDEHGKAGRPTARLLMTGAVLALALVLINLVHLLLTRALARSSELATRSALGASRWRLTRLFLTESLLFGGTGLAIGLVLACWLTTTLASRLPTRGTDVGTLALVSMEFDVRVVTFASAMALAVALVGGLWPGWRASRLRLASSAHSPGGTGGRVSSRLSRTLLASEVAVSTVVLTGAVFAGVGIWRFLNQPLGFELQDRFNLAFPGAADASSDAVNWVAVREAVRRAEGVQAASAVFESARESIRVGDRALERDEAVGLALGIDGVAAIGLHVIAGRAPTPDESAALEPVALVDAQFVRRLWPDGSAIGKRVSVGDRSYDVIGVVQTPKFRLLEPTPPFVVIPSAGRPERVGMTVFAPGLTERQVTERVTAILAQQAPGFRANVTARTFDRTFGDDIVNVRFQRPIVLVLGLFAFSVVGIGLFGVVAYLIEQRTRDFGVQIALGARPADIWHAVAGQSLRPTLIGLVLGLAGAWALSGLMRAGMFGWESSAPVSMAAVVVLIALVASLAVIAPARRVLRIDPSVTLRSQ
jgi:predicted permease